MLKLPPLPQLQPRERLLALGGGIMLLVVLLDRLVLSAWIHHARIVRQDIQQMEESYLSRERLLARKERILTELARHQRYLRPPIAEDLETAALLREIEEIASQSHIIVGEVKPLAVESTDTTAKYALELKFECTPEEWVELVYRIETAPSLFEVIKASLSTKEDKPDQLEGFLRVVSVVQRQLASPAPQEKSS